MAKQRVTQAAKKSKAAPSKLSAAKAAATGKATASSKPTAKKTGPKTSEANKPPANQAKATKNAAKQAAPKKRAGAMAVGVPGTEVEAKAYLASLPEPRKSELAALDKLIRETVPGLKPFFQSGMLAYGPFHYKYASGREGDWFKVGLSSRAQYIALYCCASTGGKYVAEGFKPRLPKADIGKSCVRFKRLSDVDMGVVKELLKATEKAGFGM